jgi:hypothetical protein
MLNGEWINSALLIHGIKSNPIQPGPCVTFVVEVRGGAEWDLIKRSRNLSVKASFSTTW